MPFREAQTSLGSKKRRDDNTNAMYETPDAQTKRNCIKGSALERSVETTWMWWTGVFKTVLSARNLTFIS